MATKEAMGTHHQMFPVAETSTGTEAIKVLPTGQMFLKQLKHCLAFSKVSLEMTMTC